MAVDFSKALKKSKGKWAAAREKAEANAGKGGYGEFEDGRYLARMVKAEGKVSDKGPFIQFDFKFKDGEYDGQSKPLFQNIESEDNLYWLGRLLGTFGYELPDELEGIQDVLDDLNNTKPLCKIRLKTKGEWQNLYVEKVISDDGDDDDAYGEDENGDEDVVEEVGSDDGDEEEEVEVEVEEDEEESDDDEEEEEEEEEEEDDLEEGVDLEAGMRVSVATPKGERVGVVHAIDEDAGVVKVKDAAGKIFKATPDQITVAVEPPPEPAKKIAATTKKK
jgi:hypothetical protein